MGVMKPARAATRRHLPGSPFNAPEAAPVKVFAIGDRVTHDKFGLGEVIGVEEDIAVLVKFGAQQVRVTTPYARMSAL
jgi:hypothetical protein